MKVAICGRNLDDLFPLLAELPLEIDGENPDVVVSYGGDGSLLGAERAFPGVPKCPLRDWRNNPKCPVHDERHVLTALVEGTLSETRICTLEGVTDDGRTVAGINDVCVGKQNITSAVRFRLWFNNKLHKNQIVGDGLVIATPFGSTGYYRNITRSSFHLGLGVAFNNSSVPLDHLVVPESTSIRIEILRGPAVLLADNSPDRVELEKGQFVTIRTRPEQTHILGLDIFRCPDCYRLREDGVTTR